MIKTNYIQLCNSKTALKVYQQLFNKSYATLNRSLFGGFTDKKKVFNERKLVGYSMEQMFTVVSDVGNYNKFVPFCKKSIIRIKSPEFLKADLEIGFPPIVEKYSSNVTLVEPRMVKAICVDGRLFDHLNTTWKFSPALKNNLQSCIIDFYISFEFKSVLHSNLAHLVFDTLVRQMEIAFINEARVRYGLPSVPTKRMTMTNGPS